MRQVHKPWPPKNVSPADQAERSFAEVEREYLAALSGAQDKTGFARTQFDQIDKAKLREVMYGEQRSICAYCERRIKEGFPFPRIDHWNPLSKNHRQALCWKNLYLSCPTPGTCDDAKGDRSLRWKYEDPDSPWPADFAYEEVIGYTSRGDAYVRSDVVMDDCVRSALELAIEDKQDGSRTRTAILNLNHPALVAARAAALDSERTRMQRDFEGKTASRDERTQRALELSAKNPLPQFVSIRAAWLQKMLGKGR